MSPPPASLRMSYRYRPVTGPRCTASRRDPRKKAFSTRCATWRPIRKQFAPHVKTDLDELGVILPEDGKEIAEPRSTWNLAGAMYADLYAQCARMGIKVIGESQLFGYKSKFPSVSMMNHKTSEPNGSSEISFISLYKPCLASHQSPRGATSRSLTSLSSQHRSRRECRKGPSFPISKKAWRAGLESTANACSTPDTSRSSDGSASA